MKRLIAYVLFVFILNIENNFSQCGALGIELKSQKDVDEFPINYPGCHRILGDLLIENTDITNLDSLYVIDTIDYYLSLTNNYQLENIRGLRNLKYVQDFYLVNDTSLKSLQGLENLENASNSLGLNSLNKITNLQGLDNLKRCRQFSVSNCNNLTTLSGIGSMSIVNTIHILSNGILLNLDGLSPQLTYLDHLYLINNSQLKSLTNLENLDAVWILDIEGNQNLVNLNGLDSITLIGYLHIKKNSILESISALHQVNEIRVRTSLIDNPKLSNIDALSKANMMTMDSLVIVANPMLDVCAIESICVYLADSTNPARIFDNGTFCLTRDQIEMECLLLPLELITFEATEYAEKNAVSLTWTTAHEKNIKSIEIEHRTNSKSWHTLSGKINLAKSQNSQSNYQFNHYNPEKTKNYYRLKINEQSGAFSYSGLKIIDFTSKKSNISCTINNDQILINSSQDEPSYLDIHDIYGRRVFSQELHKKSCEIDLNQFDSGLYILNINSNQKPIFTQKFIR
jgi:hypothetical protein